MPLNDNDLLLINDSQDSNEAKKIKYSTLKSNINGDSGNDLQAVTDNGNTTTNGAAFGDEVSADKSAQGWSFLQKYSDNNYGGLYVANGGNSLILSDGTTNKVEIKGSDGSATFGAGNILLNGTNGNYDGKGQISVNRTESSQAILNGLLNSTVTSQIYASGSARFGDTVGIGNITGGANISLNADGSADFEGTIRSGPDSANGALAIRQDSDSARALWVSQDSASASDATISLFGNGSATFKGQVDADRTGANDTVFTAKQGGTTNYAVRADGSVLIGGASPGAGDSNIRLNPDGSASFAGSVDITDGALGATRSSDSGQASVLYGVAQTGAGAQKGTFKYNAAGRLEIADANNNITAAIEPDGSATFANHVRSGESDNAKNLGGVWLNYTGVVEVMQPAASPQATQIYKGIYGTTTTFSVTAAGVIDANNVRFNLEPDNEANYTVTTEEYEDQEELTPYIPAVPATYDEEGNELTAEVPAVEATYQTVTKTREIRTYNGPTLDVKDRVMNLISRLDALEANEVIDDATDSSLLQLIASASSRLDSIEARLAALEGGN